MRNVEKKILKIESTWYTSLNIPQKEFNLRDVFINQNISEQVCGYLTKN